MTEQRTLEFPATFKVEPLEPINTEEPSAVNSIRRNQQKIDEHNSSTMLQSYVTTEHLAVSIYDHWVSKDIVGVQPLEGPVGLVYSLMYQKRDNSKIDIDNYMSFKGMSLEVMSQTVEATTRSFSHNNGYIDLQLLMDELGWPESNESKHLAEIVDGFANELDVKVINNLRAIATTRKCASSHAIIIACHTSANDIARLTRRGTGNRFIFGKKAFEKLVKSTEENPSKGLMELDVTEFDDDHALRQVGTSWNINDYGRGSKHTYQWIYTSNALEDNEVLIAYKGGNGEVDCNYFYCPYVMLFDGRDVVDPKSFKPAIGKFSHRAGTVFSEYGLSRSEDGKSNYHQLVTFEDL